MPKEPMLRTSEVVAELVDALLVVSINQSYPGRSIYNAARFAWLVSKERAAQVEYVIATKDRRIVGVFVPERWLPATEENFPEFRMHLPRRRAFVGREAEKDVFDRYLGKLLPPDFKFAGTGMRFAGTLLRESA